MMDVNEARGSSELSQNSPSVSVSVFSMLKLRRSLFSIMDAEMPDNAKKLYAGQIRGEHDLLYFDVSVCGSKFKALLDCGASREFIDLKAAQDRGFCMK